MVTGSLPGALGLILNQARCFSTGSSSRSLPAFAKLHDGRGGEELADGGDAIDRLRCGRCLLLQVGIAEALAQINSWS